MVHFALEPKRPPRLALMSKTVPIVIPSSMRFYTALPSLLIDRNPGLAVQVIAALNRVDRHRNHLWRQVIGDKNVGR